MATFSRIKIWVSNEVLTAAALNAEFDNLLNNMTPTGIEDASANVAAMQASTSPGGLGTESLATSLLGEIQRIRYVLSRMVNIDLSQKWYESPTRSFGPGDLNVELADMNADSVDTTQLVDASVTPAKLSAKNLQQSAVVTGGTQSTTSTTNVDVAGLSVSITTSGRPVRVYLMAKGTNISGITTSASSSFATSIGYVSLLRASTVISDNIIATQDSASAGIAFAACSVPASSIMTVDSPAAGTYTYKAQFRVSASGPYSVTVFGDVYLVAEEIS